MADLLKLAQQTDKNVRAMYQAWVDATSADLLEQAGSSSPRTPEQLPKSSGCPATAAAPVFAQGTAPGTSVLTADFGASPTAHAAPVLRQQGGNP